MQVVALPANHMATFHMPYDGGPFSSTIYIPTLFYGAMERGLRWYICGENVCGRMLARFNVTTLLLLAGGGPAGPLREHNHCTAVSAACGGKRIRKHILGPSHMDREPRLHEFTVQHQRPQEIGRPSLASSSPPRYSPRHCAGGGASRKGGILILFEIEQLHSAGGTCTERLHPVDPEEQNNSRPLWGSRAVVSWSWCRWQ